MIDVADNNAVYYYHYDGLGSVAALSNIDGEVVERYSYDVFGEPNRSSDVNNPYMFTGRRYDPYTGLYYYRGRYYNPEIGRFLQPDPIGYAGGINLYGYCGNNPINSVDPYGLTSILPGLENMYVQDGTIFGRETVSKKVSKKESKGQKLGEPEFQDVMNEVRDSLANKNLQCNQWPLTPVEGFGLFGSWDSKYHHNPGKLYYFRGRLAKGSELNYYAMGMLMKHRMVPRDDMVMRAYAWKRLVYHHAPSKNTMYFLWAGYDEYKLSDEGQMKLDRIERLLFQQKIFQMGAMESGVSPGLIPSP